MKLIPTFIPEPIRLQYRRARAWILSSNLRSPGPFSLSEEEKAASSGISIIIPVHDSPHVVERCFQSLELFAGKAEIIIVDDGSRLSVTRELIANFTLRNSWKLIRHEKPCGHSQASYEGILAATKPILCLLNSDTLVTPCSWAGITEAFALSSNIAVVGPSTSYTVGPQMVMRACYCRHYWDNNQIFEFGEKYAYAQKSSWAKDLKFAGGFAFFIRRTAWNDAGGFDRALPDYGNETELCVRLLKAGQRIVWTKKSYIHHLGSESYGLVFGHRKIRALSQQAVTYVEKKHRA